MSRFVVEHLTLEQRLERRINTKEQIHEFYRMLQQKGHFLKFDDAKKDHAYAVQMEQDKLVDIVGEAAMINRFFNFYTVIVKLRDGAVKVLNVI